MHKRTQKKRHTIRKATKKPKADLYPMTHPPRSSSRNHLGLAPELDTELSFQVYGPFLNAAGAVAMRRYRPNALYDVDPVLGSTTVPQFTELSALYAYNRVIAVRYELEFSNLETFPLNIYTILLNTDPGTLGHIQLQGNRQTKQTMLSGKGGMDRGRLVGRSLVATVVGTDIEREDNFRGTSAAVPVDQIWLGIGCYSPAGTFLPNGVLVSGRVFMKTRFYDPIANVS